MTRPASPPAGPTFDLPAVDRDLRRKDAYRRDGHTARTLVRAPDLRIVLVVMRAGARIAEHRAAETVSIHAVSGHIRLRVADETVDLPTGRLLVLEGGVSHDVEAIQESAFLLTLGWKGSGGS
jgi:quercetin dioxygenase-like cupin family protein